VNDNFRQFVFGVVLLVIGAGLEEILPKGLGVGFPILLTAVQALAAGGGSRAMVLILAVVAGAFEDAVSSLPLLASVSYFVLVVVLVRNVGLPRFSAMLTYPCYQLWLVLWTSGSDGGIFSRLLLSFPIGGLTACTVGTVIAWANGKGAIDERD